LTLRGGAEMTVEPLVATNKVVKTAGLLGGDSALEEPAVLGGDDVEGKICTWDHSVCKPGSEYYCYDPCWELGQCGYASCLDWDCTCDKLKAKDKACSHDYECASNMICYVGTCFVLEATGAPCAVDAMCASGKCDTFASGRGDCT